MLNSNLEHLSEQVDYYVTLCTDPNNDVRKNLHSLQKKFIKGKTSFEEYKEQIKELHLKTYNTLNWFEVWDSKGIYKVKTKQS